jgi:hypothetical protein
MPYADPAKRKEYIKGYYERNADKLRARSRAWKAADPARARENERLSRSKNPELYREHARQGRRRRGELTTAARIPADVKRANQIAFNVQRKSQKLKATPIWADLKEIRGLYIEAQQKKMHVDHIVPLRSKLVCGLHCAANLRLLSSEENHVKGNRYWPDMP